MGIGDRISHMNPCKFEVQNLAGLLIWNLQTEGGAIVVRNYSGAEILWLQNLSLVLTPKFGVKASELIRMIRLADQNLITASKSEFLSYYNSQPFTSPCQAVPIPPNLRVF